MKIVNVVGARPNFMKIAPLIGEMQHAPGISPLLVHTGQHYDEKMSQHFFDDLGIPKPDINLEVGSGSHAQQTGAILQRFEPIVVQEKPDLVLVVGDVNSTIACALTAVKLGVRVAHVEAGLRSWDRSMPEEVNRVLTDAISDYLFTTEERAEVNLVREGIASEKIFFVGNTMIDSLLQHKEKAMASPILTDLGLQAKEYCLATLHRPSNVDSKEVLHEICQALTVVSETMPIVFPCHPRTRAKIEEWNFLKHSMTKNQKIGGSGDVTLCNPVGYLDFMKLMAEATVVITDSGGIQEETSILKVPCLTVRPNTERPVTISHGTNKLIGNKKEDIIRETLEAIKRPRIGNDTPPLWDGKASSRIIDILLREF